MISKYLYSSIKKAIEGSNPFIDVFLFAEDLLFVQQNSIPYKKPYQISSVKVCLTSKEIHFLQKNKIPYEEIEGFHQIPYEEEIEGLYHIPSVKLLLNPKNLQFLQEHDIPYKEEMNKKCRVEISLEQLSFCH